MDSQSALALIDESADRPPMKGDSQGLSQGLQAKYRDRITGVLHLPGKAAVWAPLPADLPPALASALKARGMPPVVTLMHFAYPAWLDAEGGWENGKAVDAYKRHAAFVAKATPSARCAASNRRAVPPGCATERQ